jgi:hypothetical protein
MNRLTAIDESYRLVSQGYYAAAVDVVEYPLPPMITVPVDHLPTDRPGGVGVRAPSLTTSVDRLSQCRPGPGGAAVTSAPPARSILPGGRGPVDGKLVICRSGRLDFAALQQRLHPSASRASQLSLSWPAVLW